MQYFENTIQVHADDLDDLEHVNNIRYIDWVQDISKAHWNAVISEEVRATMAWVVLHHDIRYKGAAKLTDTLIIRTHIASSKGAISTRVVDIIQQKTNEILVQAKTQWCLLNKTTYKPIRIPESVKKAFEAQ